MVDIEITTHGNFQIATARSKSGFTAWGKIGKIQATSPIEEPEAHVWFQFGETRDAARTKLLIELGLAPSNALSSPAAKQSGATNG